MFEGAHNMAAAWSTAPPPFLPTPGTPVQPWLTWKALFLNYLDAIGADEFTPKRKRAILLGMLGQEGQRVVSTFNLAGPALSDTVTEFDVILTALDRHFGASVNVVVERMKFMTRLQAPGESILQYVGTLRHLASFCDFGDSLESRVAEMFLAGIQSTEVRDRLIREAAGTGAPGLERAVFIAQQFESSSRDCDLYRRLHSDIRADASQAATAVEKISASRGHDGRPIVESVGDKRQGGDRRHFSSSPAAVGSFSNRHGSRVLTRTFERRSPRDGPPGAHALVHEIAPCSFCGRQPHPREQCPALGETCFSCGKLGHFAHVCRSCPPTSARDRRQMWIPSRRGIGRRYPGSRASQGRAPIHGIVTHPDDDYDDELRPSVYAVESPEAVSNRQRRNFIADVQVNGFAISLLIDTGSEVSILSDAHFNRINGNGQIQLVKPPRTLMHYLQGSIPVLGCFNANVVFNDRFANILFYVVRKGRSLLGTDAVHELKLILSGVQLKCFHVDAAAPRSAFPGHLDPAGVPQPPCAAVAVSTLTSPSASCSKFATSRAFGACGDQLASARDPSATCMSPQDPQLSAVRDLSKLPCGLEEFEELFSPELGLVKNQTHTVTLRHHIPPVQAKLRRLPITLRESVSAEIQRLERLDIIERINASEWVSPIVVVKKKDGGIRMCVDLRAPNRAIVIDSFPLPHIDELLNSLKGASHFSKLDLASAYHQVRLDPNSRDLTAFITHEGLFRFKRVCFGLASAPAAFQQIMSNILRDCQGVKFYLDDVIVYGSSPQEHDANLREVLTRIKKAGMKLNKKAVFNVSELFFLGHRLSAEGVAPLPSKIDEVLNFPVPSDPSQLKAFLGLVEYYSKFILHCATVVEPMRRLLRKGVSFFWSSDVQDSFQKVKTCLQQAPILSMFDTTLPVIVSTDASNYGLGAVLQQQHGKHLKTVAFASRSLTEAERKYSTGEKEALAILWACEKWHIYLWGRQFTVQTDHQALVTLMSTQGTGVRPHRISRWTAKLFNYNFLMEYRKGSDNIVADALSRLPVSDTEGGTIWKEEVVSIVCASLDQKDFQDATSTDHVLSRVIAYISSTWPPQDQLPPEFQPYYVVRDQLSEIDGLLFQGERIVVPSRLRDHVITVGHETHQGITRTTSLIKELYWWPHINQHIKQFVQNCTVCQATDKPAKASPAPLQPVEFPSRPWTKLGVDLVGPFECAPANERFFITLVDYHSKWPEAAAVHNVTTASVIDFLRSIFAREGLPEEITTDNGPQFTSREFAEFLKMHGIRHVKSSLYHPQSNGQVERFNRVLKSIIQLALVQHRRLYDAVVEYLGVYRSTRHAATGETPAFLLHGRNHRTRLHLTGRATPEPRFPRTTVQQQLPTLVKNYQDRMKKYSDSRRAVKQPSFAPGHTVKVFKPRHRGKLQMKYSSPHEIHQQVGPATYKLDDGTNWNAAKLTHTTLRPRKLTSSWVAEDQLFPLSYPPYAENMPGLFSPAVPGPAVSDLPLPHSTVPDSPGPDPVTPANSEPSVMDLPGFEAVLDPVPHGSPEVFTPVTSLPLSPASSHTEDDTTEISLPPCSSTSRYTEAASETSGERDEPLTSRQPTPQPGSPRQEPPEVADPTLTPVLQGRPNRNKRLPERFKDYVVNWYECSPNLKELLD